MKKKTPWDDEFTKDDTERPPWNEFPQRKIYLDAYYIDRDEVSVAQYTQCFNAGACGPALWQDPKSKFNVKKNPYSSFHSYVRPKQPVTGVSWFNARDYCTWKKRRLPTEAEWEKAARGKNGMRYPWGDDYPLCENIGLGTSLTRTRSRATGNILFTYSTTVPVTWYERCKSPYGVRQMLGNVSEWVSDWYRYDYYKISPSKNPQGPSKGKVKVKRGSCWICPLKWATTTRRLKAKPDARDGMTGIRCALSASAVTGTNIRNSKGP